jgi:hypothetical protein
VNTLYFLVPNQGITHKVVEELHERGLDDDAIGVIARDDIELQDLPEADVSEISDVKPSARRGIAVGGATGLMAGLVVNIVPGGLALGGVALAAATVAGSAFGAWVSSLVGVSVPNSEVETYRQAIDHGQILMVVHTGKADNDDLRSAITKHHPEVVFGGEEHVLPPLS